MQSQSCCSDLTLWQQENEFELDSRRREEVAPDSIWGSGARLSPFEREVGRGDEGDMLRGR